MLYLESNGIQIEEYSQTKQLLSCLEQKNILLSKSITNTMIYETLDHNNTIVDNTHEILQYLQSIKNETELTNIRKANIVDGSNLVRLMSWLRDRYERGQESTEWQVSDRLTEIRGESALFIEESFPSIVGSGA